MRMSKDLIDNTLHGLYLQTIGYDGYARGISYMAIAYYIDRGIANCDWIKALAKANPSKLMARLERFNSWNYDEIIKTVTKYLVRHCGYKMD